MHWLILFYLSFECKDALPPRTSSQHVQIQCQKVVWRLCYARRCAWQLQPGALLQDVLDADFTHDRQPLALSSYCSQQVPCAGITKPQPAVSIAPQADGVKKSPWPATPDACPWPATPDTTAVYNWCLQLDPAKFASGATTSHSCTDPTSHNCDCSSKAPPGATQ